MNQAGFRPGRGCSEHIHVLRRVLEGCKERNIPIIAIFVDFKKAFDSVDRTLLFKILRNYGVPETITNAIRVLYNVSKSAVLVDGEITSFFDVITGVLQGDVLAPFLFIVVIDWIMRNSNIDHLGFITKPRRSRRYPNKRLGDLEFADDIALLENNQECAQQQLDNLCATAHQVGLEINAGKTKVVTYNLPENTIIELEGNPLEKVDDFQYLGSYVGSTEKDLKHRKGKAWSAFWKLDNIWTSKADLTLKLKLFNSSVLSVLLYGSETWVLTPKLQKLLNSFYVTCLRIILGIDQEDHVTNDAVHRQAGTRPLTSTTQERQLRYLGHCLRRPQEDIITELALYYPSHGKRSRGRPQTMYLSYIAHLLQAAINIQPTEEEIRSSAQDRKGWQDLVKAACCFDPP